jgi:hypothetical protein
LGRLIGPAVQTWTNRSRGLLGEDDEIDDAVEDEDS